MVDTGASDDFHAIMALVAKFDDAVNRRDHEEFCALWTETAVWEIGPPRTMRIEGADKIRATWAKMIEQTVWLFRGSFLGSVNFDGDKAQGRWPCIEAGSFREEGKYDNYAIYHDRYVRTPSGWQFATRRYEYLRLTTDILPQHEGE